MKLLITSAGKHSSIIKRLQNSVSNRIEVYATSNTSMVPAIYTADKRYVLPNVENDNYITELIKLCRQQKINAITTMLDIETKIIAANKEKFEDLDILVLNPSLETANYTLDKYKMYKYCIEEKLPTIHTLDNLEEFKSEYKNGLIDFPVFVKPRTGRGSVGIKKIYTMNELIEFLKTDSSLMIQEYIDGKDIDVDVYVDTISKKPVGIFSKEKLESKIGGATKTISFIDDSLNKFVDKIVDIFDFSGPINIDLFYKNGQYILNEINPRFGANVSHAFEGNVDFGKFIYNNVHGIENESMIGKHKENIVMMVYNDAVFTNKNEL